MLDTTTNQVEIVLIRHGKTEGNKEKPSIVITDQPLSEEGIAGIKENLGRYPSVEKVYASPMKRTRQTAELIYPGQASELVDGLREMDMGVFEGKNHAELKNRPSYILWVATRGKISIPGGESMKDFGKRTMDAFTQVLGDMQAEGIKRSAVVAHGGTIMSIVSQLADDDYYKYMVNNGAGFRLTLDDDGKLLDLKPLLKEDNCMQDALEELED